MKKIRLYPKSWHDNKQCVEFYSNFLSIVQPHLKIATTKDKYFINFEVLNVAAATLSAMMPTRPCIILEEKYMLCNKHEIMFYISVLSFSFRLLINFTILCGLGILIRHYEALWLDTLTMSLSIMVRFNFHRI